MHFANVGNNVWIGDFESCNAYLKEFPLSIHIWRDDNVEENRVCDRIKHGINKGMVIKYQEGDPFKNANVTLRDVVNYSSQDGKLLVHCAGGICRASTVSLIAKMARGCSSHEAVKEIHQSMWMGYSEVPEFYCNVIKEIYKFFDVYNSDMLI